MKRLNKNYDVSPVIMALATNKKDKYIGATVKFKPDPSNGSFHRDNTFVIGGTQKVWGYNKKGEYTMIDGYRAFSITCEDELGAPCSLDDLIIISMPKKKSKTKKK